MADPAAGPEPDDQPPIADYALIGDCHGSALVSRAGSIDWCCLRRFDNDPLFFRLLDRRGGFWDVVPDGLRSTTRGYLDCTNVLRTVFETDTGTLAVEDFLPVGRRRDAGVHDYVSLSAPAWLVRRFEGIAGRVTLRSRFRPSAHGFDLAPVPLRACEAGIRGPGGLGLWTNAEATVADGTATLRLTLEAGAVETCVLTEIEPLHDPRLETGRLADITRAFWREWVEYSRYRGPHAEAVTRSALALKLLTYAPTGAIVAAPTTSLPEEIGGERNYDYRYSWLRDSTFALYALAVLGYSGETRRFSEFLTGQCLREGSIVNVMYAIDGEPLLPERALDALDGYRGSRPVRVGNAAATQRQLDVLGELLDWAHLRRALRGGFDAQERALLEAAADHVCDHWQEPDQGLWEARTAPRHYTHGKALAWVALDRAARLFGDRAHWASSRAEIIGAITANSCTDVSGRPYLPQSFGSEAADASLLQLPLLGLPLDPALLDGTVRRVEEELREGDVVLRYRTEDGLRGKEGALLITSFWLVDAMLATGRRDDAVRLFRRLLGKANDVGLFAEEIAPEDGAFLGNFPQAFSHLALISSATLLHLHGIGGAAALAGGHAERARRLVGATEGWRAFAYALVRNRSVRLVSSQASVMALR